MAVSLRARVLVGSLVVALLLVGAAVGITRMTEAHLLERVDDQLDPRARSFEDCEPAPEPPVADPATPPAGGDGDSGLHTRLDTPSGAVLTSCEAPAGDPGTPPAGTEPPPAGEDEGEGGEEGARFEQGDTGDEGPSTSVGGDTTDPQVDPLVVVSVSRLTADGVEPVLQPGSGDGDGSVPAPRIDADEALAAAEDGRPFTTGSVGSDTRWRARAVVEPATGQILVVAQSLDDLDAIVERLVVVEVAVTLAILAALGLVAWWVDRHGIRPVNRMTAAASAIAAGDLSHRVPVGGGPRTEAGRLGVVLNGMLARIEEAFDERARSEDRLRRFVADASHELRTPVTTIRGYAELYAIGGLADPDELSEALRRTGQEAARMGKLVDDLLLLARLDQGPAPARGRVDLGALVVDAGRDARAVDPARRVEVDVGPGAGTPDEAGGADPLVVEGDADRLRQVLANLVGNALVHTPSAAGLSLTARRDGDRAVVEVADRGPGMTAEQADRAFERFYRVDPSRSRHRGGSGLGLAIVQACVVAHGGDVRLDSRPGRGTVARVRLPLTT